MEVTSSNERRPMTFIALTLVLACPFWVLGTMVTAPADVPLDLPWTALVFVTPVAAALLLVRGESGRNGVRELLTGAFDPQRIGPAAWYVPTLLLMPAVVVLSGALMTLLAVEPEGTYSSFLALPALFLVFFVAALCEEVGWTARILIVWLYNTSGRSVLVAVLFHTMINTSASLSPYTGSPAAPYVWTVFTALAAVVVTRLGWPKAQYRLSEETRSPR